MLTTLITISDDNKEETLDLQVLKELKKTWNMSDYFVYKIRKIEEPYLPIKDGFPVFVTLEDKEKQIIKEK